MTRVPTFCPIGAMESSAPREKSIMPAISSPAPNRKESSTPAGMGAKVTVSRITVAAIGSTAPSASFSFSRRFFLYTRGGLLSCFLYFIIFPRDAQGGA